MRETLQRLVEGVEARCYGTGVSFLPVELPKNNGTIRYGVQVRNGDSRLAKLIYVEDIIKMMEAGEIDEEEAVEEFEEVYRNSCRDTIEKDVVNFADEAFANKERMLENVRYAVYNRKWNKELLCKVPHKDILDLVAFYEIESEQMAGQFSCKVTYEMMEMFGITIQELDAAAEENKRQFIAKNIFDVMIEMLPEVHPGRTAFERMRDSEQVFQQYVITTPTKIKGAVALLYPEMFEAMAKDLDNNLYIIPSSIHEIIVMTAERDISAKDITNIIGIVNTDNVEPEDRLSDHVYLYKRGSMQITM